MILYDQFGFILLT